MINIAIDGPSAAGKSTIAKKCAALLGYRYLDTGAMYQCLAYAALENNVDENDETELCRLIDEIKISFDQQQRVYLNNKDVSEEIRLNKISMHASNVSRFFKVREKMVKLQQQIASDKGYIVDGRDIGSVVLPDAELKIYMVASVQARAQRRIAELVQRGQEVDEQQITAEIIQRDEQDTTRQNSPLLKVADAIEIDTSDLSIDEVVEKIMYLVHERI